MSSLSYAYGHNTSIVDMIGLTVGQCLEKQVQEQPDEIAFKFSLTKQSFTYKQIKEKSDQMAQHLLAMGFKNGDALAIMLPNIPEMVIAICAASSIGVVLVLLNPAYQQTEVEYMLKKTNAKGVIILDNLKTLTHYHLFCKICPELEESKKGELSAEKLPTLKHIILVKNRLVPSDPLAYKGVWMWEEIEKYDLPLQKMPNVDIDDNFIMMFTSGSTGFPKAAVHTHFQLVNSSRVAHHSQECSESMKVTCIPIPMFHAFGLVTGFLCSIANGCQVVFPHFFPDALGTLKAIQNEKCTALRGSPTIFLDLINHADYKTYDLSSLEYILVGATIVPKDLLLRFKTELNIKNVTLGWGMTETGCVGCATTASDLKKSEKFAYESIGRPSNFLELKVVDAQTRETLPTGQDGELCVRGPFVIKEYFNDKEKTDDSFDKNGWFKTGDIVCMDEEGYCYFKTRIKEMIIRGGINIYPFEIETFLRTNPEIHECYAFGVEDIRLGEEVAIWIKLKADAKLSEEDVRSFCKGNIAHYKIPKFIKFVDSFPISATGKVQKFKMTDQMKNELNP